MSRPSMWNVGRGELSGQVRSMFLAAAVLLSSSSSTWAFDFDWDAGGASPPNGTFQVAINWNPTGVPSTFDTADFNISDTYTVTSVGIGETAVLNVLV